MDNGREITDIIAGVAPLAIERWDGAAARGLRAREQREQIIKKVLRDGDDFGTIPGCGDRKVLKKSGAEKIADSLDLWPDYEPLATIENFDKPLFSYRYRCTLRTRGQNLAVASGIGSCNSLEARYRWRDQSRKCPTCGLEAIIKGREEFGGGWLCFKKKGGCGAKFKDNEESIIGQPSGRVENDDVFTQVNTIDKMAQKRAMVAASLNLGFSDHFTQDIEDAPEAFGGGGHKATDTEIEPPHAKAPELVTPKARRVKQPPPPPNTVAVPTETARRTGFAMTFGKCAGMDLAEIPIGYLTWLWGQADALDSFHVQTT